MEPAPSSPRRVRPVRNRYHLDHRSPGLRRVGGRRRAGGEAGSRSASGDPPAVSHCRRGGAARLGALSRSERTAPTRQLGPPRRETRPGDSWFFLSVKRGFCCRGKKGFWKNRSPAVNGKCRRLTVTGFRGHRLSSSDFGQVGGAEEADQSGSNRIQMGPVVEESVDAMMAGNPEQPDSFNLAVSVPGDIHMLFTPTGILEKQLGRPVRLLSESHDTLVDGSLKGLIEAFRRL